MTDTARHRRHVRGGRVAAAAVACVALAFTARAADSAESAESGAWKAARGGGAVMFMRHATAPGIGDPPDFRVGECATQRNLSAAGRAEAQAVGAALRDAGITVDKVWSSQWCRCLETAERLGLAPVEPLPLLNSTFRQPQAAARQTTELEAWIADRPSGTTTFLVTHQVNIIAATSVVPRSGEIVVALRQADGRLRVAGTIPPP